MWAEPKLSDKKTPRNIYLGSTPGGIEGKALQKTNRVARFKLLAQVDVPDLHAAQFEVSVKGESEPKLVEWAFQNHIEPWVFGNCAETYSYLQLLL
jgi:hypothetical protein